MPPERALAPSDYRPDIDGLRAVAVVAVMLFHLEVPGFAGGYAGVDVFFVISGFLITRILLRDLRAAGPGRIAHFYARRVMRIFPALIVVAAACALAGWFLLLPSEIARLGESLVAASLFAANLYFLGQEGYQSALAQQAPLLHLWSLSVEEQFYLLYPWLLAWVAWKLKGRHARVLAVVLLLSWLLAIGLDQRSANAAFLFGPARAWELLLGGLLACSGVHRDGLGRGLSQTCGLAGAVLIALAVTGARWLPASGSLGLLLPCVGAALVILAGTNPRAWTHALLACRPVVALGLVSYSLYLWHWPLIVFYRAMRPLEPGVAFFVIPASLFLAALTWRFVEQPFRRVRAPDRRVLLAGASAMAALALAGALLLQFHTRSPVPQAVRELDAYADYRDPEGVREGRCFLPPRRISAEELDREFCLGASPGKPTVLLVGDSHAAHLWHGLARAMPDAHVQQVTGSGCKPLFAASGHPGCAALMREALNPFAARAPDVVILAARWSDTDPQLVRETVARWLERSPRVIVLGPAVEYHDALPRLLALERWHEDATLTQRGRVPGVAARDAALAQALRGSGARFVSLHALICPAEERCVTQTPLGVPLQFDYGHFTREGAYWIAAQLRTTILP